MAIAPKHVDANSKKKMQCIISIVYLLVLIEFVNQFTMSWMNNMEMKYDRKQNLTAYSSRKQNLTAYSSSAKES